MIMTQTATTNLIYLLIKRLNRLDKLAYGGLELYPSQEGKLSLCVAFLPKMRKSLSWAKDSLFFPLYSHFRDEAFIILIEFEGDINSADEIAYWIFFEVDIE